jgi:transposase
VLFGLRGVYIAHAELQQAYEAAQQGFALAERLQDQTLLKTVGGTAKDHRLFVEAVMYRYRAGIPWRDLPERFGDWKHIHRRHRRWSERGVWKRVFASRAGAADKAYAMSDATIGRGHPHAAGAKGGTGKQSALGAAKVDCPPQYTPPAMRWATRPACP